MLTTRVIQLYYTATALFLLLDFVFSINVRLTFLEAWPNWRIAYYLLCFGILAISLWRPAMADVLGALESLVTLVAIILAMAVRVLVVTDEMIESGTGYVSGREILNFAISGGIAWLCWQHAARRLIQQGVLSDDGGFPGD